MGFTLLIDACNDEKVVGRLAANLAKIARAKIRVARGFVLPAGRRVGYGISNEISREIDKLSIERAVIRFAPILDDGRITSILPVKKDEIIRSIIQMQAEKGLAGAIIVQEYHDAELVGKIYSQNPYTGDENEILAEIKLWSNKGVLGEDEPEMILINKRDGAVSLESGDSLYIEPEQIQKLYRAVRKAEKAIGTAVSLDWFFANGVLYILGAREI